MISLKDINSQVSAIVKAECEAAGQMTLGSFIESLEKLDGDKYLFFDFARLSPDKPRSYRGYYDHLAFGFGDDSVTVSIVLNWAREALGKSFEGYKGGDYTMGPDTPLWAANYGNSGGNRFIKIEDRGWCAVIRTQMDED